MKKSALFLSFLTLLFTYSCSGGDHDNHEEDESMTEVMEEASDEMMEEMEEDEDENERTIMASELPELVSNVFSTKYADAEIDEVEEITDADGNITYEIEFEKMDQDYEVIFNANGDFVEESMENEDDDDDDDDDDDNNDDDDMEEEGEMN